MTSRSFVLFLAGWVLAAQPAPGPQASIRDLSFHSQVFGEERNYRVFLPPDYDQATNKRYPVVYFFHGWSERHNRPVRGGQSYDSGDGYGGDTIAAFVSRHDLIVVKWDGSNPRTPGEDYIRPYNISPVETERQFPLYFPELVRHIDSRFRTLADRDHRATAGLSMGGFMSYWIAGKYPHLVGSASNFMGSSEFIVGPKAFPVEYRHTDMYRNYEGMRTRIVMGSKDFIRWYHRRMNLIWDFTRPYHEHEEFNWDHGTPGMAKTLDFHMRAFRDPLPPPALWHHADVYPDFDVWGWSVASDRRVPGFTFLENVNAAGFRSTVRQWLPAGAILASVKLRIATAALYRAGHTYDINDVNLDTSETRRTRQRADSTGRLHFELDGRRHEVGIAAGSHPLLTIAGWSVEGAPWATAGQPVRVKLTVLNKGSRRAPRGTLQVATSRLETPALAPGQSAASGGLVITPTDPHREIVKLMVNTGAAEIPVEIPLFAGAPPLTDFRVLDGAPAALWERAVRRVEKPLGSGNGDGQAQPGETIAIAIPDGEALRAAELFSWDSCVDLTRRLSDGWGEYDHVGASAKITLARIREDCPPGREIPLFVRVQIPNKPEHTLKEGVVRLRLAPPAR